MCSPMDEHIVLLFLLFVHGRTLVFLFLGCSSIGAHVFFFIFDCSSMDERMFF